MNPFFKGQGSDEIVEVDGAAEAYLELFEGYGVDYIFCSPGSEFIPFWEFLAKFRAEGRGLGYVNARHEGLALAMARGYTMATRIPQVVLLHVSFGLLHGAMEIKAAYNEKIPMVIICGQNMTHEEEVWGGSGGAHYLAFSEVGGTQRLVQPYVKWCNDPHTNLNMGYILSRAFRTATSEPRGPVFLSLSRELMFEKVERMKVPMRVSSATPIQADPRALKTLASLLVESDNPIIYTRYLGRNPGSVKHLVDLADLSSVPVLETPAYTNFPTDHPLHLGYDLNPHLKDADLILIIDSSGWPPWYPPSSVASISKAKIVFIDVDPLQVNYPYWGYPADLLITADSALALPSLIEEVRGLINQQHKEKFKSRLGRWRRLHESQREEWKREALEAKNLEPIDPRWLCYSINQVIDPDTIIVNETITHWRIANRYIEKNRVKPGRRFEGAGATASAGLGQGLGVALGLKLAHPNKTVIALEGDGSLIYNPIPACFALSQEYHLPILTIVFDNRCYAAMRHHPRYYPKGWSAKTGTYYGVSQEPKPEYTELAEGFGGYAEEVEDPAELEGALLRCLERVEKGRIALLDVLLPKPS